MIGVGVPGYPGPLPESGDVMDRKIMTRREALAKIGKTGLGLSTTPLFFLSLKTEAFSEDWLQLAAAEIQAKPPRKALTVKHPDEKTVISGSASKISITVSGPAGRYCAVAVASSDTRSSYRPLPGGRGVIGGNGVSVLEIDTKGLPDGLLLLRIVTASSGDFRKDVRGTQAFQVEIARGRLIDFTGIRQRPLENATTVASAAAACYGARGG